MKMKQVSRTVLSALAATIVAGSAQSAAVTGTNSFNSAWGWIHVWAAGGNTVTYTHDNLTAVTFSDDATAVGPEDFHGLHNIGMAGFHYDLASGTVGAFALANNNRQYDWSTMMWRYYDNAAAATGVSMADDLYFTIPPGSYVQPLKVRLLGHVEGDVSASGNYAAHATFKAALGQPGNPAVSPAWQWDDAFLWGAHLTNDALAVNDSFTLEVTLLQAGTSLAESKTVGVRLGLVLGDGGTLSAQPNVVWPDPHLAGAAHSSFANTLRIYALEVPAGVTWTSSSGVFLTELQPIPEPAVALLMTLGVACVGVFTHRPRGG